MERPLSKLVIAIKGAGEMATGIACRLFQANFRHIFMMETEHPLAVRRLVSFCEAVHEQYISVEGIQAIKVNSPEGIHSAWDKTLVPVLVDPEWKAVNAIQPHVVIDAIIAKKNLGTRRSEARLVIGLGPGFEAGKDVHRVIETNRGHNLGRVLLTGCPAPNTGIPGNIGGYTKERVLRAPCPGVFISSIPIGTLVKKNDIVGHVDDQPVTTRIEGVLRGLIRDHSRVSTQLKIGDVDPRGEKAYCTTVSEKARAIGGSVLEAILSVYNI